MRFVSATSQNAALWSVSSQPNAGSAAPAPSPTTNDPQQYVQLAANPQLAADLESQRQHIRAQDSAQNQQLVAALAEPNEQCFMRAKAGIFAAIREQDANGLEFSLDKLSQPDDVLRLGDGANNILFAAINSDHASRPANTVKPPSNMSLRQRRTTPRLPLAPPLTPPLTPQTTPLFLAMDNAVANDRIPLPNLHLPRPAPAAAIRPQNPLAPLPQTNHNDQTPQLLPAATPDAIACTPPRDLSRPKLTYSAAFPPQENMLTQTVLQYLSKSHALELMQQKDLNGQTPLHRVVATGNFGLLTMLLGHVDAEHHRALLHQADNNGKTPLHWAVLNTPQHASLLNKTRYQIVQYLLNRGGTAATVDHLGMNACHYAAELDDGSISTLFQPPKTTAEQDREKALAAKILIAINKTDIPELEILLQSVDIFRLVFNAKEKNIFFTAIEHGNVELMTTLLNAVPEKQRAALLSLYNIKGQTLLHIAGSKGQVEMVIALLSTIPENQRLALLSLGDNNSNTPLHLTVQGGKTAIVAAIFKVLSPNQRLALIMSQSLLHLAVECGKTEIVTILFSANAVGNHLTLALQPNNKGQTPLYLTVELKNSLMMTTVFNALDKSKHFALIQKTDHKGQTPLHLAIEKNDPSLASQLLAACPTDQQGALVQMTDEEGQTSLHLAVASGNITLATMLLKHVPEDQQGALVQMTDEEGQTLLHLAAASGNIALVSMLFKYVPADQLTAFIQKTDKNGEAPLHRALQKTETRFQMLQLLLRNGATVDSKALMYAAQLRNPSVLALFLDPKTNELMFADSKKLDELLKREDLVIDAFDSWGWNALMYAIYWGDEDAADRLQEHKANLQLAESMLGAYHMPLAFQLAAIQEHVEKSTLGTAPDSNAQNTLLIYQKSLEQSLETAQKTKKTDEKLIAHLEKGLTQIAELNRTGFC